ncbi:MAG: DNA repair protein RadC [Sporomusaceae bacterium]|nr:DNA repair protein RadC [Sporomusaceae bacterium]
MKKRFLADGLEGFADHEVLEMLLFYAVAQRNTNVLAHRMINEFGSLANLFAANAADIAQRCGVSEHVAILVALVAPLSGRYHKIGFGKKPLLNSSAKAGRFAATLFAGRKYECFYVLCLDVKSKLNHAVLVHEGTLDEVPVYPRLIVEAALTHKAATVIVAHNHPGGTLMPSENDKEITRKIKGALEAIAIHFADHIIVAGEKYYSFSENGVVI